MTRAPNDLLPLPSPTLHILAALSGGEKHGYAIMQEVDELSDGIVSLGPGTLYGAVKRLLKDGLIEEVDRNPNHGARDERRRYYRLTALGQAVCSAELDRLRNLLRRASRLSARLQGA